MSEKRTGRKEIRKAKNRLGQKPGQKLNQWSEDRMKGAIMEYREQVETGQAPQLRMIARAWNVPKSTLQRRVKNHVQGYKHASGRKPVLPKESEAELVKMIKTLSKRGFPLRRKEIQLLAYQYAQANNLPGFSEKKRGLSSTGLKILCAEILTSAKGNRRPSLLQEQQGLTPQQLRNGSSSIKIFLLSWESRMCLPTFGIAMRQECRTIFYQPL